MAEDGFDALFRTGAGCEVEVLLQEGIHGAHAVEDGREVKHEVLLVSKDALGEVVLVEDLHAAVAERRGGGGARLVVDEAHLSKDGAGVEVGDGFSTRGGGDGDGDVAGEDAIGFGRVVSLAEDDLAFGEGFGLHAPRLGGGGVRSSTAYLRTLRAGAGRPMAGVERPMAGVTAAAVRGAQAAPTDGIVRP